MAADLSQQIVEQLRQSRKYRFVCEATLNRMADWALERHKGLKPALKAAKRKLHQVYGAYLDQVDLKRVENLMASLGSSMSEASLRQVCREILSCHISTAERLDWMAEFYGDLFSEIGRPSRILDLGCGLHPFALPWMELDEDVIYEACDIDRRLVACISRFLKQIHPRARVQEQDVLVEAPAEKADVIFLFKALPCLEQQDRGIGKELVRRLQAPFVVISFPTHSLGGREKGMAVHYEKVVRETVGSSGRVGRKLAYPDEVFYVVNKI